MKVVIFLMPILWSLFSLSASAQVLSWQKQYNGPTSEMDSAVVVKTDASGFVYVAGTSLSGDPDYFVIKYNASGAVQWGARFDQVYLDDATVTYQHTEDRITDMIVDAGGNVYVTGISFFNPNAYHRDVVTVKYNSAGVKQWQITTIASLTTDSDYLDDPRLAMDSNGNIYVTASSINSFGQPIIALQKINPAGSSLWNVNFTTPADNITARAIAVDGSGSVLVTGSIEVAGTDNINYLTVKYNANGVFVWQRRYDGPTHEKDEAVKVKTDGSANVFITGTSRTGDEDIVTIKYNSSGTLLWSASFDQTYVEAPFPVQHTEDTGLDLQIDASGNTYVTGISFFNPNAYHRNVVTVKYSSGGTKLWQFTSLITYTASSESLKAPQTTLDAAGNVYLAVSYQEDDSHTSLYKISSGGTLIWKTDYTTPYSIPTKANSIRLSRDGSIYITGMIIKGNGNYLTLRYLPNIGLRQAEEENEEITGLQAYPMPFKNRLTIAFSLPNAAQAEVMMYDGQGRMIQRLFEGKAEAGKQYEVNVPCEHLAPGIYFSKLKTPLKTETKKLLKIE